MTTTLHETQRLRLRPLAPADAPTLHRLIDSDEAVWRWDAGHGRNLAGRRAVIARRRAEYRVFGFGCYAITLATSGELIGQSGLSPWFCEGEDGTCRIEFEVMFTLGRAFWGHGYATEAARHWVDQAFAVHNLDRLTVSPLRDNHRSIRVLQKLGFDIADDPLDPTSVLAVLASPRRRLPG
jgi:RimJ/RimL family protein N-acetyltransferase